MGIKEKDLQTIEQLSDGDKLRVVTSDGNSRNIDASQISGGGSLFITRSQNQSYLYVLEISAKTLFNAFKEGKTVYINQSSEYGEDYILFELRFFNYNIEEHSYEFDTTDGIQYKASSDDAYPTQSDE